MSLSNPFQENGLTKDAGRRSQKNPLLKFTGMNTSKLALSQKGLPSYMAQMLKMNAVKFLLGPLTF
jgi:hypothetical protein